MYLSKLVPNVSDRAARRDLANPYDMHRTLLRAFPDAADGGCGRVLFCVDPPGVATRAILVQSEKSPNWNRLPANHVSECQTKSLAGLTFFRGQRLRFRLRANPTKRAGNSASDPRWVGKRVGLGAEKDQEAWLVRKGEEGGFQVSPRTFQTISEGRIVARKAGRDLQFFAVWFEGTLVVTDPVRFTQTLHEGIGTAKGLGFGLLSLAPSPE